MSAEFEQALREIEAIVAADGEPGDRLQRVVETIRDANPLYAWVGIYYLRGDALELGPFVGLPTVHTRIPVGTGVCGTAVQVRANQLIDDVRQVENYLSCSDAVRSELVVLIWHDHDILGQIDIDSDEVAAFTHADEAFLEQVAGPIAPLMVHAT